MYKIDLNCDLGESFGNYKIESDEKIIPLISSANVACGYHAGDPLVMKKTVLFSIGVLSVLFVSCRQNDNILSNEDVTTLKIIQKNRNIWYNCSCFYRIIFHQNFKFVIRLDLYWWYKPRIHFLIPTNLKLNIKGLCTWYEKETNLVDDKEIKIVKMILDNGEEYFVEITDDKELTSLKSRFKDILDEQKKKIIEN